MWRADVWCVDWVTASGVSVGDLCNVAGTCLWDGDIRADDVCATCEGRFESLGIMLIFGRVRACSDDQTLFDGIFNLIFIALGGIDLDDGRERIVDFCGDKAEFTLLFGVFLGVSIACFVSDQKDEDHLPTDLIERGPTVLLDGGL